MSFSRLTSAAGISILAISAAIFAPSLAKHSLAQAPPPPPQNQPGAAPPHHDMPAPINLKVLPRNLTGPQVHEIMEKWEGELGSGCKTCHAEDPKNIGPNGKPRLNFADDSKPEKKTARLMYKMTEDINKNYVSKVDNSGEPVSCGTCHRGHLGPEPFVPKEEKEHAH